MKRSCLFLILVISILAIFKLDGYCVGEGNVSTTDVESVIQTLLGEGFNSLHKEGNFSAAIPKFEQVLVMDAENSGAYFGLGSAYLGLGDPAKAKEYFVRSIMANFENAYAYDGLGNCYRKMGDHKKAEEYYNKAIILNKEYAWSIFDLGSLYSEDKNIEGALKQAEILATLDKKLEMELRKQILIDNPNPNL